MTSPKRRPRRKRVVLASRKKTRPVAKMLMDLEEQTSVGEVMVSNLMRVQLRSSLILGTVTMLLFGSLPLLFWLFEPLREAELWGIRLPWLVLGVLPYPVLLLIGYLSTRSAQRHERDFERLVERL